MYILEFFKFSFNQNLEIAAIVKQVKFSSFS